MLLLSLCIAGVYYVYRAGAGDRQLMTVETIVRDQNDLTERKEEINIGLEWKDWC